nr:hypothetical protein BaRGS_023334 [Batillaria attramentaria]
MACSNVAADKGSPGLSVLGQSLQRSPAVSHTLGIRLQVASPDWEIAPNFLFLNMKAGDKLVHKTLDSSDINDHLLGTQFHLRFLSTYEEPQNIIDMEVDPHPFLLRREPVQLVSVVTLGGMSAD